VFVGGGGVWSSEGSFCFGFAQLSFFRFPQSRISKTVASFHFLQFQPCFHRTLPMVGCKEDDQQQQQKQEHQEYRPTRKKACQCE
jgi:hypothetical protein